MILSYDSILGIPVVENSGGNNSTSNSSSTSTSNNGINLNNLELFNKSNLFQIDYTKTQWKSGNLFF